MDKLDLLQPAAVLSCDVDTTSSLTSCSGSERWIRDAISVIDVGDQCQVQRSLFPPYRRSTFSGDMGCAQESTSLEKNAMVQIFRVYSIHAPRKAETRSWRVSYAEEGSSLLAPRRQIRVF